MKDRFTGYGLALTIAIHAGVILVIIFAAREGSGNTGDDWDPSKATVVEASLAFKKEVEKKQPQKRFKKPPKKRKVRGVSRDANKKVKKPKKKADDPPKLNLDPSLSEDEEDEDDQTDEDLEVKKTVPKSALGTGKGSKYGDKNVTETKCNRANYRYKYLCDLAEDMRKYSTIPDLFKGKGHAVGCLRMKVEGRIIKTKLAKKSGEANIDGPIKIGLRKLMQKRNARPKKIPQKVLDGLGQPNAAIIDVCFKIEA